MGWWGGRLSAWREREGGREGRGEACDCGPFPSGFNHPPPSVLINSFKGVIGRSKSQAFFLVFCTFLGLVSLALVLSIQFQDFGGQNWFYVTLLSPYACVRWPALCLPFPHWTARSFFDRPFVYAT